MNNKTVVLVVSHVYFHDKRLHFIKSFPKPRFDTDFIPHQMQSDWVDMSQRLCPMNRDDFVFIRLQDFYEMHGVMNAVGELDLSIRSQVKILKKEAESIIANLNDEFYPWGKAVARFASRANEGSYTKEYRQDNLKNLFKDIDFILEIVDNSRDIDGVPKYYVKEYLKEEFSAIFDCIPVFRMDIKEELDKERPFGEYHNFLRLVQGYNLNIKRLEQEMFEYKLNHRPVSVPLIKLSWWQRIKKRFNR